jgi:phosphohistidine phosphatase
VTEYTDSWPKRYPGKVKTLLLMRHAKSDWKAKFDHDHERPLNTRGVEAARLMGRILARAGEVPESVVTSSAVRAKATIDLAAEAGQWASRVRATDNLYNTRPDSVLDEVSAEPDTTTRLMIVGHEPTWSALLTELVGGGRHPLGTAAVARIDFPAETWSTLSAGTGELRWLLTPRLAAAVLASA